MASLFQPSPEERLAKIERQKQLQQQWRIELVFIMVRISNS